MMLAAERVLKEILDKETFTPEETFNYLQLIAKFNQGVPSDYFKLALDRILGTSLDETDPIADESWELKYRNEEDDK